MADRPAQYGLKYVDVPYTQDNVGDPKEYLFYDGLHLATNLQQRLARLSANIILGQSVMPP